MSLSSTSPKGTLAIVIVNWNVWDHVRRCLVSLDQALAETPDLRGEIWVVDNGSQDGSPALLRKHFPHVHLLALTENAGFAAANNLALRALGLLTRDEPMYARSAALAQRYGVRPRPTPPQAVLFLNPDTEVMPSALGFLWETLFANRRTGVVGPRLVYPDGSHQHSGFRFPTLRQVFLDFFPLHGRLIHSRLNGRYARVLYEGQASFPVDFVLGAAMLVRREVIERVGAFDEGYWLYCEEMDWARRIRAAGWEIRVDPRARVVHHEGQSSRQFREEAFVALWRSRLRYFRRYHGPLFNATLKALIRLGLWHLTRQTRHLPPQERAARQHAYARVRRLLQEDDGGADRRGPGRLPTREHATDQHE